MTLERALLRMRDQVILQRVLVGECRSANDAHELFVQGGGGQGHRRQIDLEVLLQAMLLEAELVGEDVFARFAAVFEGVSAFLVARQKALSGERPAAQIADERLVAGVESHVTGQVVFEQKRFAA